MAPFVRQIDALGAAVTRAMGSAGPKGAMVAEGHSDAYVAPHRAGKGWNVRALDARVTADGGRTTDWLGRPANYCGASLANDCGSVVSNRNPHTAILTRLAELIAGRL